ncbi:MAG: malonate transporter subunit MadL [Candidatus Glassbacteria bacterium]|nr:malonate transporter subunit MadL [Candidatus Glassbacteria bacterium]
MIVYGVAILSGCMLVGLIVGEALGALIGVKANVGGVGISMILLILLSERYKDELNLKARTGRGIGFWSAMYIPVVVAMAAQQNVLAAITGGAVAVLAGSAAVVLSFVMVMLIGKFNRTN